MPNLRIFATILKPACNGSSHATKPVLIAARPYPRRHRGTLGLKTENFDTQLSYLSTRPDQVAHFTGPWTGQLYIPILMNKIQTVKQLCSTLHGRENQGDAMSRKASNLVEPMRKVLRFHKSIDFCSTAATTLYASPFCFYYIFIPAHSLNRVLFIFSQDGSKHGTNSSLRSQRSQRKTSPTKMGESSWFSLRQLVLAMKLPKPYST
jgi:hypothetical protein